MVKPVMTIEQEIEISLKHADQRAVHEKVLDGAISAKTNKLRTDLKAARKKKR